MLSIFSDQRVLGMIVTPAFNSSADWSDVGSSLKGQGHFHFAKGTSDLKIVKYVYSVYM